MWLPHTVTVEEPSDGGAGTGGGGVEYGDPVTVICNVQPQSATEIFDNFGPECQAESSLWARVSDAPKFAKFHTRVTKGSQVFWVSAKPKIWDQGLPTDHVLVALTEKPLATTS